MTRINLHHRVKVDHSSQPIKEECRPHQLAEREIRDKTQCPDNQPIREECRPHQQKHQPKEKIPEIQEQVEVWEHRECSFT